MQIRHWTVKTGAPQALLPTIADGISLTIRKSWVWAAAEIFAIGAVEGRAIGAQTGLRATPLEFTPRLG